MENTKKTKIIHIVLIILGTIFILLPAFHSTIWFDESYSVAIAKHSFIDIWKITGNDVHPALYYWLLHVVYLIFGNTVLIYRLFSVLAIIILGVLGYTHIRKDFGEKTGILFSFLTFFLPIMCTYASEIRMYSWACLFVTLMAIYGFRYYNSIKVKAKNQRKNLVLFGIFSICCCYIHYYGLAVACLVNLLLLIFVVRNYKETKNNKNLIEFLLLALIQIILYVPWLIYFVGQLAHVGGGFWINVGPVNTTVEVLSFQFRRQLDTDFSLNASTIVSLIAALAMYAYVGFRFYKTKKENEDVKPAILGLIAYLGTIGVILIISIVMPILYSRYLLVITGIYIFVLAFMMATEKNKIITYIVCAVILVMGVASNVQNIIINYDEENMEVIEYIQSEIQDDDIIIYSNIGNGGVIAAYFPEVTQYFLNFAYWDVEEAYKAYGPGMETVTDWSFLESYTGRIWLIDSEGMGLYNELPKENITVLKEVEEFDVLYHEYVYNVMLLEKN